VIDFSPLGQRATQKFLKLHALSASDDRRSFVIPLPEKGGRRLVISDIHGCVQTFARLLSKVNLNKEDQLFLLGDLIDRGPYSYNIIVKIWELLDQGYQIYILRGNHEQLFIDLSAKSKEKLKSFAKKQYTLHLLTKDIRFRPVMRNFFKLLPHYYITGNQILVHAGINTSSEAPLKEYRDMLWIRSFQVTPSVLGNRQVIHGHVPTPLNTILKRIKDKKSRIPLDNGCIRAGRSGFGRLLCLNLDTNEVLAQKNVDLIPV
jgi:serine/threonine protein phosphatase 1